MSYQWTGALLISVSCISFAYSLSFSYNRQLSSLQQLIQAIRIMYWELQYHHAPLPDLCVSAADICSGQLRNIFKSLKRELDWQCSVDVEDAMKCVLKQYHDISPEIRKLLLRLGTFLGRFDTEGQLQGLAYIQEECEQEKKRLEANRSSKLRGYQTMGFCTAATVVIILA